MKKNGNRKPKWTCYYWRAEAQLHACVARGRRVHPFPPPVKTHTRMMIAIVAQFLCLFGHKCVLFPAKNDKEGRDEATMPRCWGPIDNERTITFLSALRQNKKLPFFQVC